MRDGGGGGGGAFRKCQTKFVVVAVVVVVVTKWKTIVLVGRDHKKFEKPSSSPGKCPPRWIMLHRHLNQHYLDTKLKPPCLQWVCPQQEWQSKPSCPTETTR